MTKICVIRPAAIVIEPSAAAHRWIRAKSYLRPAGRLVLVEYDTDRGNPWVPFPVSFRTWTSLAVEASFRDTRRIASVRSRFLGSIYSVMSLR